MPTATVADALQLVNGIAPAEIDRVVAGFDRLDERLRSFPAGTVTLQLSVKERDTPSQRTTLRGVDRPSTPTRGSFEPRRPRCCGRCDA